MSAPQPPQQQQPQPLHRCIVKQVLSGDTVVIRGQPRGGPPPEKTIYISNITAPKLAKRPTETVTETRDEPFAWEAREFLRKKLVGQEVVFSIEYSVNDRDYVTLYLGKDASGENMAESLVRAGLVDVRTGGKGEAQQRLRDLHEEAQAAGRGKHGPDAASHVRDVKWTLRDGEDPRTFADRMGKNPVPAVVEHVRDGSTVRVLLLPDFHYITLMLSGIRCPSSRPGEPESQYAEEAKYFTESRLLQRDVEVVLEGATNQNFFGTVLHPNGNIAEHLLRVGFARCVDWSLASVTGGADRLRAAEKEAKEKRLRLWKDYKPTGIPIDAKEQRFEGKVMEVINADALVVKVGDNELRKIFLSSIRPPKRPEEPKEPASGGGGGGKERNFRPLYDIPFMYEAREFLRKKLIGKQVQVCIDYKQPASNSFPEKTCCTVTIGGINVAEALVGKGLATVVRYRQDDDQRSAHYNDLLAAEMKAQKSARGLHSKKDASVHRVVDLAGDLAKSKQFLPFLQRAGKMEAVVEFVASGSRLRLYIPRENCLATFLLAGISCPRAGRQQAGQTIPGEKFGEEALQFTKSLCLQREVEVVADGIDKAGNFIGWLTVEGVNLSVALVKEGLATVHFTAERSVHYRALQLAEEQAKQQRLKIWEDYEETEDTKPQEVITDRKGNYRNVLVTEVKPDLSFYVQFFDDGPKLEEMTKLLRQELAEHPPVSGAYTPKKGEVCAARFSEDQQWYRARVEKVQPSGSVEIFFIDYGNRDTVDPSSLASLPSLGIRDVPPAAREYTLALVALPKDPEQAQEAVHAFQEEVLGEPQLQLNVEYRVGGQEYVTLLTSSGNDVGKALLQEGWVLLEERRDRHLQELLQEYTAARDSAKAKRLNLWCYGDVTEDDSKEFGWGR
ncbi:staphylococcal nuclease domain-containing protein 1 [Dermacentor variabilis]|uniref:staphylococcal nuclease domain-containing protein 1 n=1 Tax=Dermacentor variabilis TaxID=34621 RepID=UPI003F5BC493